MGTEQDVYYERGPNGNDPLTVHAEEAGEWSSSADSSSLAPAVLPPQGFNYSTGMFVGVSPDEADAMPGALHPHMVKVATSEPVKTFETIHEATHRRYDAPFTVAISQAAAGFTLVAPPRPGLHYLKVLAAVLQADAAGTVKFVQGSTDGTVTADVTGAIPVATNAGFTLAPAPVETPWFFTSPDLALGIFSGTSKISGFVTVCYSPFDA